MRNAILAVTLAAMASPVFAQTLSLPDQWNFMNALEQAAWLCDNREDQKQCAEAARLRPNSRRSQEALSFPVNWNFMNAWEQASWLCDNRQNMAKCAEATRIRVRRSAPIELAPTTPAATFAAPTTQPCGRACGQTWTAEDFAAADAEIARLEQELARLRQRAAQPTYAAPTYTPPPPPIYTPYRYTPPTPMYSAPSYEQNSGSTYDWRSGNRYSWYQDSLGTTHVRGSNGITGSMWRSTIDKDGQQRGTDSNGNMWRYNPDTGSYINYGTGEMCFGRGAIRTCSGGSSR